MTHTETGEHLTIHLLGTPQVSIAGKLLTIHHQKARALLYYLSSTNDPCTRDHLASLLWSESPESNARHSLRSCLYHIRQTLHSHGSQDTLISEGDLISLHLSHQACDVPHFRQLLAENTEETLTRAAQLYHGLFLQGFTLVDAPLFEDWQCFESDALAQAHLTTLQRLTSLASERQDWKLALSYTRQLAQLDPLSEQIQQDLLRLYLRNGAVGQALHHYQLFENALQQELGLSPSPKTQALLSEILRTTYGSPSFKPGPSTQPEQYPTEGLPFVGQNEVRQTLLTSSHMVASSNKSHTFLIQGDDGSGRSRLMRELVTTLRSQSPAWIILQGSCSPFDDLLSYGPFLEAFQMSQSSDLSDLLTDTPDAHSGPHSRFLWKILQTLQILTREGPLLLTIDDLQWANTPTLHLFGFLATRLRHLPVLLIGTTQRVESIPTLQRLVTLRRRHGDVSLLSLSPLTEPDVHALTRQLGIDSAQDDRWATNAFSQWLFEKSDGSPFILTEMIAQLQTEKILLPQSNGSLRLNSIHWQRWRTTFTFPKTTHDLVAWRLTHISHEARTMLDVLAVASLPLPFPLLREFSELPEEQLQLTVETLKNQGLAVESEHELWSLAHHLVCETILSSLSQSRQEDIHRHLARTIEQCPILQDHFPMHQLALHAVAGADSSRARRYGFQILTELVRDNANASTATFLLRLYRLLTPTATPHDILLLTSALGRVYQSLGQLDEAAAWHRKHLNLAKTLTDPPIQASAHFELGELALVATDFQAASTAARAGLAIALPTTHTTLIARGHRLLGAALAMEGSDLPSAEYYLQEAANAHRLIQTADELCATLFELGNVAAQYGHVAHALHYYQEAAETAQDAQAHYILALAQNNLAYHTLLLGNPQNAWQSLRAGKKVAEQYELFGARMHLASTQGEIHLYLGEWAAAAEAFHYSLALAEELLNIERQAGNQAGLALAARGQGDLTTALLALKEVLALLTDQGYWHLKIRVHLWLAETLTQLGQFTEAENQADTALTYAQTQGRTLLLLQAERLRAALRTTQEDWPGAQTLFTQSLARSSMLALSLETARTKAAWGLALLNTSRSSQQGLQLISEARTALTTHDARAELLTIASVIQP